MAQDNRVVRIYARSHGIAPVMIEEAAALAMTERLATVRGGSVLSSYGGLTSVRLTLDEAEECLPAVAAAGDDGLRRLLEAVRGPERRAASCRQHEVCMDLDLLSDDGSFGHGAVISIASPLFGRFINHVDRRWLGDIRAIAKVDMSRPGSLTARTIRRKAEMIEALLSQGVIRDHDQAVALQRLSFAVPNHFRPETRVDWF